MNSKASHSGFTAGIVILAISIVLLYAILLIIPIKSSRLNDEFPSKVCGWTSENKKIDKVVLCELRPDAAIDKVYRKKGMVPVELFMASYDSLDKCDLSHSPVVCLTGQGWHITNESEHTIALAALHDPITVNRLILHREGMKVVTYYWYQSARRAYANRGIQKYVLAYETLKGKSTGNAFVRVLAFIPPRISIKAVETQMDHFIADIYPDMRKFLR